MRTIKAIFLLIAGLTGLIECSVGLGRDQIRDIAARDIYDLLSKIITVQGITYGITAQPVYFKRTGKTSGEISLYIDNIYYGKEISDISFLQIDNIDSLAINGHSVVNDGLKLEIFTRSFKSAVPVSEVRYKDAFFNYRDLSADIFQYITPDLSFLVSGSIFDWKDNRDKYDDFKFPNMRQNYRLKLNLPQFRGIKPVFDVSYIKEDKYLLASDSSHVKPEQIRSALSLEKRINNQLNNRFTTVHLHEISGSTDNFFSFYNTLIYTDTLNVLSATAGFDTKIDDSNLFYLKPEYKRSAFVDLSIAGYAAADDNSDNIMSAHIGFSKEYQYIGFETSHGYFTDETDDRDIELIENFITLNKDFIFGNIDYGIEVGYDMLDYSKIHSRDFFRFGFSADYKNKLYFTEQYLRSASGRINDSVLMNNLSQISFTDKYFNNKLTVSIALDHRYSEYYVGSRLEYMNNLSFNFTARIVNFEFYYGSDNFLKNKYEFNGNIYEANKHYRYQTVDGFDMRTMDEIWGVRWTFYR
jgi:hypothetical protein